MPAWFLSIILTIMLVTGGVVASRQVSGQAAGSYPVPVLMYHHFSQNVDEALASRMIILGDNFEEQMRFLREQGFTSLTYNDYLAVLDGKEPMPARPVLITIDDGYESNYTIAYPVLKKYGLKASIAVVVSSIPDIYGKNFPGYPHMSWAQMQEMEGSGLVEFHNHTFNLHRDVNGKPALVARLDGEGEEAFKYRVRGDLIQARRLIEEHFQRSPNALSFPYGAWDQAVMEAAIDTGHRVFPTYHWGYADGNSPVLPRILIDDIPIAEFVQIVEGKTRQGKNP